MKRRKVNSKQVKKKVYALFLAITLALVGLNLTGGAQTRPATGMSASSAVAPLNLLPASDVVAFIDVKRLINEAAPKVLADNPAKLAEFNADIDQLEAKTGIDARSFDRIAVGMRYTHPSAGVTKADTVLVARGSFNSGALLAAARVASKGKYQEQNYKNTTVYLFDLKGQAPAVPGVPLRVSELAAAALDTNTLVIGELAGVHATIDASKGGARVNNDLVQLASRTPNALLGFSANVPPGLTSGLDFNNDEIARIIGTVRQAYGAVGTTQNGFDMLMVARTEKPDQARSLSDTLTALKQFGGLVIPQLPADLGKVAQNTLDSLKITSEGTDASIWLELLQSDISTLMRAFRPKPAPATTIVKPETE
jgi:hypothetical protein